MFTSVDPQQLKRAPSAGCKHTNRPRSLLATSCLVGGVVRIGVIVVAVIAPRVARAGTIRHDVADRLHTSLAAEPAFSSVGQLLWNEPGNAFRASGVLIDENWVLTAGHVVDGIDLAGSGITNMRFSLEGETHLAAEWIVHPDWTGTRGDLFAGADIGLIRLTDSVLNIEPATFFSGADERGKVATIVGFGETGTGLTGIVNGSGGTKRAGQNVIDIVGPPVFSNDRLLAIDFDNPQNARDSTFGSATPLSLEFLPAGGDSGGGAFIAGLDDLPALAGIVSFTSTSDGVVDSDFGDRAGITRVSRFLPWIDETIAARTITADFDGDGNVDGDDLLALIVGFGKSGGASLTDGDANRDGRVDRTDLDVWRQQLGTANRLAGGPLVSASIPEPSTAALLAMALCAICFWRRIQLHQQGGENAHVVADRFNVHGQR